MIKHQVIAKLVIEVLNVRERSFTIGWEGSDILGAHLGRARNFLGARLGSVTIFLPLKTVGIFGRGGLSMALIFLCSFLYSKLRQPIRCPPGPYAYA